MNTGIRQADRFVSWSWSLLYLLTFSLVTEQSHQRPVVYKACIHFISFLLSAWEATGDLSGQWVLTCSRDTQSLFTCKCLVLEPTGFPQVYLRVEETNNTEAFSSSNVHGNIHVDPPPPKRSFCPYCAFWHCLAENCPMGGKRLWKWTDYLDLNIRIAVLPEANHIHEAGGWAICFPETQVYQSPVWSRGRNFLSTEGRAIYYLHLHGANLLSTNLIMSCPALHCSHLPPILSNIHHSRPSLTCDI